LNELTFDSSNPNALSFALLNAFNSAAELDHHKYSHLKKNWKVATRGKGIVLKRRGYNTTDVVALTTTFPHDEVLDVLDIIVKAGGKGIHLSFPNFLDITEIEEDLNNLGYEYSFSPHEGLVIKEKKEEE